MTNTIIIDTEAALKSLVKDLKQADIIAFDTETTGTDPLLAELVGISLSVERRRRLTTFRSAMPSDNNCHAKKSSRH